jgi:hypothetical protein
MKRAVAPPREELYDTEDEQAVPGRLGYYLRLCRQELWPRFQRLDAEAIAAQNSHRRMTKTIASLGGAALVLGSFQLAMPKLEASNLYPSWKLTFAGWESFLPWLEGILAASTAVFVLVGLARKRHRAWLLARYQAERLRLLKFRAFADPRVWTDAPGPGDWEADFTREVTRILEIEGDELESISHHEPVPALPSAALAESVSEPTRRELLVYYRIKRLEPQTEYFERRARRTFFFDNPVLLPLVFFVSVGCVLVHFALERVRHESALAVGFAIVSLALPAAWAGVRTYRSANEFSRNRSRSLAKQNALAELGDRLSREREPQAIFGDVLLAEYILAADQHEWLRLMVEAEWYG